MQGKQITWTKIGAIALTVGLGTAALAQARMTLVMRGNVASSDVRLIGGRPFVPLADMANALDLAVIKKPGGYELTEKSGANQVNGSKQGKVGDVLLTKKYSFQVISIQKTDHYASRFLKEPETFDPDSADDTLVIVDCRLKNALPKTQGPILARSYAGNTALADDQGQSYAPKDFDSRIRSDFSGASLLPGSKTDFAVIFDVPKTSNVKDMVFSVIDYFDPDFKGTDVRVTLAP